MMSLSMSNAQRRAPVLVLSGLSIVMALGLAACGEIDQQAKIEKVYAKKLDTRVYDGDKFKGDKAKWEETMAQRNRPQNESIKMDGK